MDGIDVAVIETDGQSLTWSGPTRTYPYDPLLRGRLDDAVRRPDGPADEIAALEADLTDAHAVAVEDFVATEMPRDRTVDLVGLHGHTLVHKPDEGVTRQLGDGARLASRLKLDVVFDFRSADMAAGGEGAPMAPAYHQLLAQQLEKPVVVLNLGGVGNVTWIGENVLLAFDTGPGNGLIDDWVRDNAGIPFDQDGRLAAAGSVDQTVLDRLLSHPYFDRPPPKSLDRLDFGLEALEGMGVEDGAATLTAFTAASVERAQVYFPAPPAHWLVTGGGRRNPTLMRTLRTRLAMELEPIESVGADGDGLEAQAFAYLAVRSVLGLPTSFPGSTGVSAPTVGGRLVRPDDAS